MKRNSSTLYDHAENYKKKFVKALADGKDLRLPILKMFKKFKPLVVKELLSYSAKLNVIDLDPLKHKITPPAKDHLKTVWDAQKGDLWDNLNSKVVYDHFCDVIHVLTNAIEESPKFQTAEIELLLSHWNMYPLTVQLIMDELLSRFYPDWSEKRHQLFVSK